jgi:hypothetical protein
VIKLIDRLVNFRARAGLLVDTPRVCRAFTVHKCSSNVCWMEVLWVRHEYILKMYVCMSARKKENFVLHRTDITG